MEYIIIISSSNIQLIESNCEKAVEFFLSSEYEYYDSELNEMRISKKIIISGFHTFKGNDKIYKLHYNILRKYIPSKYIVIENKSNDIIQNLLFSRTYININQNYNQQNITLYFCTHEKMINLLIILSQIIFKYYNKVFYLSNNCLLNDYSEIFEQNQNLMSYIQKIHNYENIICI